MSDQPEHDHDEDTEDELRTFVELPEGSVLLGAVEVVSYLDPDGDTCYGFRWPGQMSYSAILGHLELVKAKVIASYHENYPDPD